MDFRPTIKKTDISLDAKNKKDGAGDEIRIHHPGLGNERVIIIVSRNEFGKVI